ncbi:MAG: hypothetical protein J0L61_00720, partial [Planctomycetes bacterium]|nr:hypothetical protein [Planctomycetota bacterium]
MGNLTNDGQTYKFEYDAFGRLRKIRDQSNNLVEEFRYNGLNHRIAWLYDADNDVDGSDPWFYFVYDRSWRMVASYRGSDAEAKELFVNHQAGLNGTQTSLPLDAFVLRDRNTAGYWADSVSSFSGERTYHCQNYFGGRGDVVAILTSTGKQMEQVRYSAYGVPFGIPAGDTNADGGVVATPDIAQITAWTSGAYNVRGDFDLDGDVDNDDVSIVSSNFGKSVGWGKLAVGPNDTLTGFVGGFRKGYCGYEHDGTNPKIMHVRHRAYLADLGRWTRRDPLGYVDGANLYGYVKSQALRLLDPFGLKTTRNPDPPSGPVPACITCPRLEPWPPPIVQPNHDCDEYGMCGGWQPDNAIRIETRLNGILGPAFAIGAGPLSCGGSCWGSISVTYPQVRECFVCRVCSDNTVTCTDRKEYRRYTETRNPSFGEQYWNQSAGWCWCRIWILGLFGENAEGPLPSYWDGTIPIEGPIGPPDVV